MTALLLTAALLLPSAFCDEVRSQVPYLRKESDRTLIREARDICKSLRNGASTPLDFIDPDRPRSVVFVSLSVDNYCPEMTGWI